MPHHEKDQVLAAKVQQQLDKRGIRMPCRVNVSCQHAIVTLTGEVQFEMQRKTAVHAAREVMGVMRVIEQLRVQPPGSLWTAKTHVHTGV
jgi:osmotically-inducible protein OsmY